LKKANSNWLRFTSSFDPKESRRKAAFYAAYIFCPERGSAGRSFPTQADAAERHHSDRARAGAY
jgi:hypothetical protein